MRVLLDECVPHRVKFLVASGGHECATVQEAGYSGKRNGELLSLADGFFDVLRTIDRNIRHQQNLAGRKIAILILRVVSNDIDDIKVQVPLALKALETIQAGQFVEVG
jgi:predicted nuclease of predicted toxin-antitoxin system